MKITNIKVLAVSANLLILAGCSEVKEKKHEATTSLIEKASEAITGKSKDAVEDNNAVVDIVIGSENLKEHFKKGFGNITATKETISIGIAGGENGQDNILIGFQERTLQLNTPSKEK